MRHSSAWIGLRYGLKILVDPSQWLSSARVGFLFAMGHQVRLIDWRVRPLSVVKPGEGLVRRYSVMSFIRLRIIMI